MPTTPPGAPAAPTGIWVATQPDYEYRLTFGPDDSCTMDFLPIMSIGTSEVGTYRAQGDQVFLDRLDRPVALKSVNGTYQSDSYGPLLTFIRQ